MKSRKSTISKALSLRLEVLENRELLSAAPWSAPVDSLDAQTVETASAQVGQEDVIDLSNAQLENSVSFANTGVADHQFAVSWAPIDGASTYSVKINRDGSWIQYNKGLTDTSCVMNGLYPGKTFDIRVCAMNENGKLTGDYTQTTFAPVSLATKLNKFVDGDTITLTLKASEDATCEIAWYYATPDGDVEITEARGLLSYAPTNPQCDVKVVATGTGLSEGSVSEKLFVYVAPEEVETNYDSATKILTVNAPVVEGAVQYYIWKPAPSGNMAIYQRTTEPVFTVSNVNPGTSCDYRVTAYDAKGTVLDALSFTYAPVGLVAPDYFGANAAISVEIADAQNASADLAWFYVTPDGDVAIPEAANQTSFAPANLDYPVKIVATGTQLSKGSVAETIVNPVALNVAHTAPYVTTSRVFDATWDAVPEAARYVFQRKNAAGNWANMTGSNVVDGAVVSGNVRTNDGSTFEYTVNMSDASVAKEYRVLALDSKGALIVSETFEYTPMGLVVIANEAYPLDHASLLVANPLYAADAPVYQWYSAPADSPEDWTLIEGETESTYLLTPEGAELGLYYKVVATDLASEDRASVSYARPDTIDAPANLVVTVDETTGELRATWNAPGATDFILQYAYDGAVVDTWIDLPAPTVTQNSDGSFSLTHPNGVKYENLRVRAVNETGWSNFTVHETPKPAPVLDENLCVNTLRDVVDAKDGVTSLREAISYYLQEYAKGTLPEGAKVYFDPNVFTLKNHTIVLDSATKFDLDSTLVVDATNLGYNVILDASKSKDQLFTVTGAKADVSLAGLTIENASLSSMNGASIGVTAGATLNLSAFKVTKSTGRFGGGIYVNDATLNVADSTLDHNYAEVSGGAINAVNNAKVVVTNTIIEMNNSSNGGAVVLDSNSTGTFTKCSIRDNSATTHGSAIYVTGGATATISGGEFLRNATNNSNGEAVYVAEGSYASITNVTFESNTPADLGGEGTIKTMNNTSKAILDVDAELLDFAILELEDEITLF